MVAKESKSKQPKVKREAKATPRKARTRKRGQAAQAVVGRRNPGPEELHPEIAERAFLLFQERGCEHGRDLEDWFNAEGMVLQELG